MVPCQDSPSVKATYSAAMKAPSNLTVLMSAIRDGEPEPLADGLTVTKWKQDVPIQSYLIAIAVGVLKSRKVGPRSHVWAEASVVDQAAFDFSETETMLQKAEELCGPYVWGIYDALVSLGCLLRLIEEGRDASGLGTVEEGEFLKLPSCVQVHAN